VKRRTEGSAHRHGKSRIASPSVIDRPYSIGNGLIGDGAEPDESASPQTFIAKIRLGDQVSDIVTSPNNSVAYAALSNSIAVISSLHDVLCIIPISGHPRSLRFDADGSRLFASGYRGTVSVIDIADHRVHVIPGARYVQQVDTVDGAFTYAAGNTTNGGGCDGWISVIDARGATVDAIAGLDGYAITDLAADPEGKRVYVGLSRQSPDYQYDAGLVGVIDTTTNAAIDTFDLGASPDAITVSPDGLMMYATHYDHRSVSAIDLASFLVTPITLGDSPLGVSMTPDGLQAYVASRCSLSVIDTVVNEAARIAVGDLPRCVRVSPDGKYAYVSNFGDRTVSVIDTIAQCVTETIDVGGHPEALAVSPDGHRLYVGDYWSGSVTVFSVQP
jgi:YVTN family beta-propeller protein